MKDDVVSFAAFAEQAVALAKSELPTQVAHETQRCFMNVLGAALGASQSIEVDALARTGRQLGGAEITVLGRDELLDRFYAATVLGFAGHFDDFDDTHLTTVIHPGAATLGALYPLGLLNDVSKETALGAMALGIEVQLRVGLAMTPSHYDLGWHITGTCGVIGAAVTAGIALGLSGQELTHAMGIAATMTVGHREAFGTPIKPYHAGKAASNGLFAASLAQCGIEAPTEMFTDDHGYFAVLSDEWSTDWIEAEDLGRRWALLDITYKPYPCGIVAHPAIEAATLLHAVLGVEGIEAIQSIVVACNPLVVELMGRPTATTGLEARFCAVHGVAVGLLTGRAGLEEFSDEMSCDPVVESLRSRTILLPDGEHGREAATITVHFRDGSSRSQGVAVTSGSTERPLTDAQLHEKFVALVEPVLPGRSLAVATAAMELGTTTTIHDIDLAVHGR